jgi:chorismate mutase
LWPLHCLVSVLFVGHLSSQVSQVLCFIPRGDAVQSSEIISVWMKVTRITQRIFPCTNSHDYYRQLG